MARKTLLLLLALVLVGGACTDPAERTGLDPSTGRGEADGEGGELANRATLQPEAGGEEQQALALSALPTVGAKVIKTGRVEVEVAEGEFGDSFGDASALAGRLGGFVHSSSTEASDGEIASGTLTIRVPSERFDAALAELRGLGEVRAESQEGTDVTGEFVDLRARLGHLQAQEAFFLKLMERAQTIADILQVQQQLSAVQLQIEEIKGRLQFLEDQTEFATITARIFEPGGAVSRPGAIGEAWGRALAAFMSVVAGLIVALGWVAPFALLSAAGLAVWRLGRRGRPRGETQA